MSTPRDRPGTSLGKGFASQGVGGAENRCEVGVSDLHVFIGFPLVGIGITDFDPESAPASRALSRGSRGHPLVPLEPVAKRGDDAVHQVDHLCFRLGREMLVDIELAKRIAHETIDLTKHSLVERRHHRLAPSAWKNVNAVFSSSRSRLL